MILSAETIRRLQPVSPFCERTVQRGMSYGLSLAGYDVRAKIEYHARTLVGSTGAYLCPGSGESCLLRPGGFMLVTTLEYFTMPVNVVAFVHDKSTWARRGLSIPPVVLEPGWKGHLTLALRNFGPEALSIVNGDPIAQIVFHELDNNAGPGYTGKYQGQGPEPVPARTED
jgi:dCTP deaminase